PYLEETALEIGLGEIELRAAAADAGNRARFVGRSGKRRAELRSSEEIGSGARKRRQDARIGEGDELRGPGKGPAPRQREIAQEDGRRGQVRDLVLLEGKGAAGAEELEGQLAQGPVRDDDQAPHLGADG